MSAYDFAPRRVGELLDDAIVVVIANWRTIVPVAAVVVLPVAAAYSVVASFYLRSFLEIIGAGSAAFAGSAPSANQVTLLVTASLLQGLGLLYSLAKVVFDSSLYSSAGELLQRRRLPLKQILRTGLSSVLPLIAVQFLIGAVSGAAGLAAGLVVGIVAFVLLIASPIVGAVGVVVAELVGVTAALVVFVLLSLAAPAVVMEKDIVRSLGRSFRMVRRHFWRVLLIIVAAGLVGAQFESALAAPTLVRSIITGVQSPSALIGQLAWGWKVFDGLAQGAAMALVLPFTTVVSLLTYFDIRARDEGMDLIVRARELLAG
jgi:hypothetical protein